MRNLSFSGGGAFLGGAIVHNLTSSEQQVIASTGENVEDLQPVASDPEIDAINFELNEVEVLDNATETVFVSVIREQIDLEQHAVGYYKKFFKDDTEVHGIIMKLPDGNTTTKIIVEGDRLRVTTYAYAPAEERNTRRLFQGELLRDVYVGIETGDIEVVPIDSVEDNHQTPQEVTNTQTVPQQVQTQPQPQPQTQTQAQPTVVQVGTPESTQQLPLKATCHDGTVQYQDHPSLPNYRGMCSGHGGVAIRHGRVP